jgi:hypothetical protein
MAQYKRIELLIESPSGTPVVEYGKRILLARGSEFKFPEEWLPRPTRAGPYRKLMMDWMDGNSLDPSAQTEIGEAPAAVAPPLGLRTFEAVCSAQIRFVRWPLH